MPAFLTDPAGARPPAPAVLTVAPQPAQTLPIITGGRGVGAGAAAKKKEGKKGMLFKFEWDATDDTSSAGLARTLGAAVASSSAQRAGGSAAAPSSAAPATTLVDPFEARRAAKAARERAAAAAASVAASAAVAGASSSAHWSARALADMSDRDWRIMREDFDIHVRGGRPLPPLRFWAEAALPASLMRAIADAGYAQPSPIQRQAIPMGLAGRDLIGIAETGSGKTAAFLIPLLCHVLAAGAERRARFVWRRPRRGGGRGGRGV